MAGEDRRREDNAMGRRRSSWGEGLAEQRSLGGCQSRAGAVATDLVDLGDST